MVLNSLKDLNFIESSVLFWKLIRDLGKYLHYLHFGNEPSYFYTFCFVHVKMVDKW